MIDSVEKVIDFLEINDLPHFVVATKEGENNRVFETLQDESFEDSKNRFRKVMDITHGNRFVLKARRDYKSTRGIFTEEFRNNKEEEKNTPSSIGAVPQSDGFISVTELEKRIKESEAKVKQEIEYEQLKTENENLKKALKDTDDVKMRVLKRVEPYIGQILGAFTGKITPQPHKQVAIGMAGLNEEIELDEKEITERFEKAFSKWQQHEPDLLPLVEKLAEMAESKDMMYQLAKDKILG